MLKVDKVICTFSLIKEFNVNEIYNPNIRGYIKSNNKDYYIQWNDLRLSDKVKFKPINNDNRLVIKKIKTIPIISNK